ncbi:MAG: glycosyltransferase family A protein [Candidatus Eisenbacteria bacterium]
MRMLDHDPESAAMTASDVSVVIPYYNGARFIARALDTVLGQTMGAPHVVIVDDGSVEGPSRHIRRYLDSGQATLLTHATNRGIAAARNTGLDASRSRFVAFLDQDDTWLPRKLELQLPLLDESGRGVGLIFGDLGEADLQGRVREFVPRGRIPSDLNDLSGSDQLSALFTGNFISLIASLVRRECVDDVGHFDERIRGGADDYEFCLRLTARYRIMHRHGVVATHWTHGDNYSTDLERLTADNFRFLAEVASRHPFLGCRLERRLARLHHDLGKHYLYSGDTAKAVESLSEAARGGEDSPALRLAMLLSQLGAAGSWAFRARRMMTRRLAR